MRLKLKALVLSALLAASVPLWGDDCKAANFFLDYNLSSATTLYGVVLGVNSNPFGGPMAGPARIKTSGSSTTVTSETASDNAFAEVVVGDTIFVRAGDGSVSRRSVTARASADSITVDTAITLAASAFTWLRTTTSATVGWLDISGYTRRTISIQYDQGDLGSLSARIECRGSYPGAAAIQVFPSCATGACDTYQSYATASIGIASRTSVAIPEPFGACRVGIKYVTSDASDATTNLEKITAGFEGCVVKQ
jgi:hypothetical protein